MENKDGEIILNSIQGKEITSPYKNINFFRDLEYLNFNSILFERPDLLLVSDSLVYGIEHFQVTSTKTTLNGSYLQQSYNERVRKNHIEKINQDLETKEKSLVQVENIPESKYEYLIENIKKSFESHYEKIEKYKLNIMSKFPNKEIKFIFFIEYHYVLSFGFTKRSDNKPISGFYPHQDINLLNYFSDKVLLEGVIFNYSVNSDRKNLFLPILNTYEANNKYLFDTKEGIIEGMKTNIINIGVRISNKS